MTRPLAVLLPFLAVAATAHGGDFTKYVDPHIGSGGHGHVFVGANVPFGAVQVGPTNFHQGWDWCSGYHYSDIVAVGFSQLHLSGTGIPDLGDILLMPYTGELVASPGTLEDPDAGYASRYSHDEEEVRPGYYAVDLLDHGVRAEMTATERVGVHRYRYPDGKTARLAVDLEFENGGGRVLETRLKQIDEKTLVGYRRSTGWARDQRVYFALVSSVAFADLKVFDGDQAVDGDDYEGKGLRAIASFSEPPEEVVLRVGISPVSEENALANVKAETDGVGFDALADAADAKWDEQLGRIRIRTGDGRTRRIFYTALYHTLFAPILFNDHNGDYRGVDKEVYRDAGFDNHTIFSLWDTYRAAHPLYTLIQPERVNHFVHSMLAIFDQQGKLPVWHLMGNETNTMVGYHAVPVIVDAYFKGLTDVDAERAFEALKASAMRDDRGMKSIKEIGYIPSDSMSESVALAMEYAIDDWCIAQMADALGRDDDRDYFLKRSRYYANYFDPETRFMRGKMSDGSWREPFNPFASTHRRDDYCEGNGWQYLWLVPQDPEGLIELLGGDGPFVTKLDRLFEQESIKTEGASADISGLIGQYAHGNEPSHHVAYLYAFAGEQWKTAALVRRILTTLYSDQPDGLSGNEDCGQMSAWYVLSAMGLYPVNPAAGKYVLGSPLLDEATIALPGGKSFSIVATNNSPENVYIQSARLNGEPHTRAFINHAEVAAGGKLELVMGPTPNKAFGAAPADRPKSVMASK